MKTKNGSNLPVDEITSENYVVPTGEERLYHIKQEIKQFNPKTGVKISVPSVQKFGPKIYKGIVEKNLKRLGYTIEVLHDPLVWLKANAEKLAQRKAEQAKTQKAKKDAEKAALKAEIMAELMAEGLIPDSTKKGPGRPKKEE